MLCEGIHAASGHPTEMLHVTCQLSRTGTNGHLAPHGLGWLVWAMGCATGHQTPGLTFSKFLLEPVIQVFGVEKIRQSDARQSPSF